uniref:Uncharacterized protein n=1 Tax=Loa loa TaxID=7209 RepID=A0A1I7VKY1_LOALO
MYYLKYNIPLGPLATPLIKYTSCLAMNGRSVGAGRELRQCLRKKNIGLAKKIRNRSLRYNVLPRAAPFLCSRCGFATAALKRIEEHVCMKKNSSVNDLERDMKVAQMAVRSRCKDAMAVLERIPNPQSIRLPKFRILESEPSEEVCKMVSLSTSLHDALPKIMSPVTCCSNDEGVQKRSGDNSSKQNVKADLQMVLHYNCIYDEYLKRDDSPIDSLKPVLAERLGLDRTEDSHLQRYQVGRHYVFVFLPSARGASVDCTMSVERKMEYRISKYYAEQMLNLSCTACETKSDKFGTLGDFHEHIMKCGKCRR